MNANASEHRTAVIDIGSNSVRLVVFEGQGRFPAVAFNEKVFCGLGRSVAETGELDADAIALALRTLDRFALLLKRMGVRDIRAVATAAVRDATNGQTFLRQIRQSCRFDVRLLTGGEEARTSAFGVLVGLPGADGLVGDLGGGSLELVQVGNAGVSDNITLPLSPFLLADRFKKDRKGTIAHIDRVLSTVGFAAACKNKEFYAVGGAWRDIARLHIDHTGYPLHILQSYVIEHGEVLEICDLISGMSPPSLARLPSVANRRAEILPLAATILGRIFTLFRPSQLVVSTMGVREGLLYAEMPQKVRDLDPLLEGCRELAQFSGRFPQHAGALLDWTGPLFPDEPAGERRLRLAACMLSDVAWRGHPDYRAEKMLTEVLYGRFGGLDHRGAALIALALYVCYGGSAGQGTAALLEKILGRADVARARTIGLALRLGQRFSGGTSSALRLARLVMGKGDKLELIVRADARNMASEAVTRRLEALAKALGRRAVVATE